MDDKIEEFEKQLAECRAKSGLSYRALERATGIKYSALAAMQNGHRPCGEQSARRLASVFGLSGPALDAFVLDALNTSRERVLESVKDYPSAVLNFIGLMLLGRDIAPADITVCRYDPLVPDHMVLSIKGGSTVHLHTTLSASL